MLTEVDWRTAIRHWQNGREVIVFDRSSRTESGGYDNFPFEELFRNVKFLADVPAVKNPEFEAAVDQMIADLKPDEPKVPKELQKPEPPEPEPELKKPEPEKKPKPSGSKKPKRPEKAEALRLIAEGMKPAEVCRKLSISPTTLYYWRKPEKFEKKKPEKPDPEPPG